MNIGILIPGFGANEDDWALPVYQNLVRELAKSHHVRVIALRYPHTRQSYTYHGAEVYPLGYGAWTRGLRRLRLWWDTFRLMRKLHQEEPFDVLHGIWADETGALSGWIGNSLKIPSVVTVAGGELVGFPDINYGLQLSFYSRWVVNQAMVNNSAIIMLSKVWVIIKFGRWNETFTHIPLGIDPNVFYPSSIDRKPYHLIHVGSLIPIKNQKILLDTIALLDDRVTLDIIGDGHLETELKAYAKKLKISQHVNFLGKVPHTQLREHYSQAQLHIMTSYHEAFGMVILEATACGTPTVGTYVGLITDAVDFIYSADYPEELAEIIQSLLDSPSELEISRQKCLQVVQDKYTIEHIANQHIKLYKSLINQ
jgi:glycosyltransferase involved in cell wall biosynthesis